MNDNLESYSSFAPYYRTLLNHRSHAKPIARLLSELLTPEHVRLLDAACGQGNHDYFDALPGRVFYASDGSSDMIDYLNADSMLRSRYQTVIHSEWKRLPSLFRNLGKFDAIFILGNAISHVDNLDEIGQIISACYDGLNEQGRLILDLRRWQTADEGLHLSEPGRIENEKRLLLTDTSGATRLQIFDLCHYDSNRQIIDYSVEEEGKLVMTARFSYLMTRPEEVTQLLRRSGFKIPYAGNPVYYSYFAICGER